MGVVSRHVVATDAAPAPVATYSQAARIGPVLAVAGQVGVDPRTGGVVSDDVAAQTEQALRNVAAVLDAAGSSLDDVVRVDAYLTDPADLPAYNDVYARWFGASPPARTTVFVGLAAGLKVEITVLAVQDTR
jgi:2-iminobutanoate/2-iminopropanoate deaminase